MTRSDAEVKTIAFGLAQLAEQINREHAVCLDATGNAVAGAIEVGRLLTEAKSKLERGEWIPWVEANCVFGRHEAWRYMDAYRKREMLHGVQHSQSLRGILRAARKQDEQNQAQASMDQDGDASSLGIFGSLQELIDRGEVFSTIYADPPWRYGNQGTRAATDNHYSTMSVEQICAEPVSRVADDNAHLHLWTTNAFLRDAFNVIDAWGFKYKSCFVWVKPHMGIGNYWRVSHEFLLFGIRGKCPFRARDQMSWGQFDRGEHSSKPDEIRQIIERVSPGPYLEMYGREAPILSAWSVYGNQVERRLA